MSEIEWCDCSDELELGFRAVPELPDNIFVHAPCGKPAFLVWKSHEKYCDECGRSFSNPWSDVCLDCASPGPYLSWKIAQQSLTPLV